ncbi:hypothetical protein NDU88_005581 [Pleurodeles waltl]|uniref:Uncharacterized protein n=1 Tax=Pleurodeles waltl TaxID=8319 RepID=A0AAV7L3F8_PLEWA|nr:hypothetical protein NDU88_005581 [Pleurodeles waltl]
MEPGGTIASGLPYPDVMTTSTNQATHPGDGGVCKTLSDGTWMAASKGIPQEAVQEEERNGHHRQDERAVRVRTYRADPRPHKRNATMAVSSPFQRQVEDQETARPENRPRSGESVALSGTVLQRARV